MRKTVSREGAHDSDSKNCLNFVWDGLSVISWLFILGYSIGEPVRGVW